jgi:hypothetical protein
VPERLPSKKLVSPGRVEKRGFFVGGMTGKFLRYFK